MKRILFSLSIILCTYAQLINADQLTDNLTDLTKALQKLEQVITGQPQSITDQIDGNLIHLNIIQSAIKFDLAQLAGYKTQSIKPSIPYDANLLDDLKMNLQEINSIVQFFTTNKTIIPANDKKQFGRQLFDIKNNLVQILTHLSSGVTTAAQATTLLQYIDEFYTKGIAAAQYRNFLGSSNYKVSDGQVASITKNMNTITQKAPNPTAGTSTSITDEIDGNLILLDQILAEIELDLSQLVADKTQNISPSIPYDTIILDGLRKNLQEINNIVQFFTTNKTVIPANDKNQFGRQLFDIKNNLVQILTHLSNGVTTTAQAATLLQYIDEFYTKGIAAVQYRNFLGSSNYKVSDGQIASITKNMNAITQKAASSTSQSTQTTSQRPTLSSAQIAELTTLITNINAFDQKVTDLVNKNDIDELYNFMTNKTMGNYVDFTTLTQKYAPYLQQEAKKQIVGLLFSIHLKLINIDRSNPKRDAILDESSKTSKFVKQNI